MEPVGLACKRCGAHFLSNEQHECRGVFLTLVEARLVYETFIDLGGPVSPAEDDLFRRLEAAL